MTYRYLALALLLSCGCGRSAYEVAEVDGVVLIHKKPGSQLRVEFWPDVGTRGPISTAETDDQGRFHLVLADPATGRSQPGAVVGKHRVVLCDLVLAASETGKGVPIRFGPEYSLGSSTPLIQEVKSGQQTIEIHVPAE